MWLLLPGDDAKGERGPEERYLLPKESYLSLILHHSLIESRSFQLDTNSNNLACLV